MDKPFLTLKKNTKVTQTGSAASGQLDKVAQGFGTDLKIMYCRRVKEIHQMQTYTDPCTYAMQNDMNRLKEEIASDLANYMLEMMPDLEMCVDLGM